MVISETDGIITYREHLAVWVRIFGGVIGAVMAVVGPATMMSIALPVWTPSFAVAVFTGLVLLLFGLFALMIAFSSAATLEFRIAQRVLVVSKRGPLTRSRVLYDFSGISGPTFAMRESEDSAYPVLSLGLSGKRFPVEMTGFANADDAQFWKNRLESILLAPG